MRLFGLLVSLGLIVATLIDGFETILQPRRVTHGYRFARTFYRILWSVWRTVAIRIKPGKKREGFLSVFGPASLLALFASWVAMLVTGFGLLHWSLRTTVHAADGRVDFLAYLYLSGTTFFTLGYGDITPGRTVGRALAVMESGLGFGFLAVIISYLPVLAQAFSRREVTISLLDARAGSPPSASQFLIRVARTGTLAEVDALLAQWEVWTAELLESHLSFPVLGYFRSQHDNQSWLAALTTMLDTCAILIVGVEGKHSYQAQLTFAMARHAAVDLGLVLKVNPSPPAEERLPAAKLEELLRDLRGAGLQVRGAAFGTKLAEVRGVYEPFVNAIAGRFMLALPPVTVEAGIADNWQRSAWMKKIPGIGNLPVAHVHDDHFE